MQKISFDGLRHLLAKQQRIAREVWNGWEAGAFGFQLHRKLMEMGVTYSVVPPQD